ncbi:hypothetical protein QR680_001084 [Steinernema hermaphroditum]|uniref:Uncharacterized protein n=1 Tax=Steinernema hermaphroditum TaxID=289476 RepID=A0AA39GX11_9BILA|nr:hypothetical protein QR680_001084 [Steinernema hermaphroditum]
MPPRSLSRMAPPGWYHLCHRARPGADDTAGNSATCRLMPTSGVVAELSARISRTSSVPNLHVIDNYKPQWNYRLRGSYYLFDDAKGRYLYSRHYYPYSYRSEVYSNLFKGPNTSPYFWSYPYRYWNNYASNYPYYHRRYNYGLSPYRNYCLDRLHGWERERYYYVPTYYYSGARSHYAEWL